MKREGYGVARLGYERKKQVKMIKGKRKMG